MKRWMQVVGMVVAVTMAMSVNSARAGESGTPRIPPCPVMGEPIDFSVSASTDEGLVYFCCKGCIKKFKENPSKFATAASKQRHALSKREKIQVNCPLSGETIDPKVFATHDEGKVYFCCKNCASKFTSDPSQYQAALASSYTYQTICPVMDGTIDPTSFSVLPDGKTVYYCCPACEKKLLADPGKYAPKLASQGININVAKIKAASDHKGHDHGHKGHDHGHGG